MTKVLIEKTSKSLKLQGFAARFVIGAALAGFLHSPSAAELWCCISGVAWLAGVKAVTWWQHS